MAEDFVAINKICNFSVAVALSRQAPSGGMVKVVSAVFFYLAYDINLFRCNK